MKFCAIIIFIEISVKNILIEYPNIIILKFVSRFQVLKTDTTENQTRNYQKKPPRKRFVACFLRFHIMTKKNWKKKR